MLGKQGYLPLAIVGLIAACFAAAPPVGAATISISPRTDCNRIYVYTDSGNNDHYIVNCHFSGVVTFSTPLHALDRVECYVGPIGSEVWDGTAGDGFTHPNGADSYGYSACCSLGEEYEWSGFYNSIDNGIQAG